MYINPKLAVVENKAQSLIFSNFFLKSSYFKAFMSLVPCKANAKYKEYPFAIIELEGSHLGTKFFNNYKSTLLF